MVSSVVSINKNQKPKVTPVDSKRAGIKPKKMLSIDVRAHKAFLKALREKIKSGRTEDAIASIEFHIEEMDRLFLPK